MDISLTKVRKSTLTREFEKEKNLNCIDWGKRALSRDSTVLVVSAKEGGNKLANSFPNCSLLSLAKYHSVIVLFLNIFQKKRTKLNFILSKQNQICFQNLPEKWKIIHHKAKTFQYRYNIVKPHVGV